MTTAPRRVSRGDSTRAWPWRIISLTAAAASVCASGLVVVDMAHTSIVASGYALNALDALSDWWLWCAGPIVTAVASVVVTLRGAPAAIRGAAGFFLWLAAVGFAGAVSLSLILTLMQGLILPDWDLWGLLLAAVAGLVAACSSIPLFDPTGPNGMFAGLSKDGPRT